MISRIMLLSLLLSATLSQSSRPAGTGSIEGTVVRAGTSEPIEDTHVTLIKSLPPTADPDAAPPSTPLTTESDGRFSFKDLEAGSYRLVFASNGYVRQEYGQRILPGKGSPIDLAPGQAMRNIVMGMTPSGSVSGRIRDKEGQPLSAVRVQLMRYTYDYFGQKALRSYAVGQTNELGEYRVYFVTPGRYYLSTISPRADDSGRGTNEVRESYTSAYYPGVADIRQATTVDVQPGADLRGINLTLGRQQLYKVSGRIIDPATGQTPLNPRVQLDFGRSADTMSESGVFEFRNVFPGSYSITASVEDRTTHPDTRSTTPSRRAGFLPLEVVNADVEGVVVPIGAVTSISGRVSADGGNLPTSGLVGIYLTPAVSIPVPGSPSASLKADGTFQLDTVNPGEYHVSIGSPILLTPWSFYLKEARFGGVDVLNKPLRFTGSESGKLELVVSPNVAVIGGVVTGERLEPIPGAQVVLVPDRYRDRAELFRAVSTDQNGRFTIPNVTPGDYKVFAFEAIEPYAYFDPEVLKQAEPKAKPVHVGELSRQTVDARVIPGEIRGR